MLLYKSLWISEWKGPKLNFHCKKELTNKTGNEEIVSGCLVGGSHLKLR